MNFRKTLLAAWILGLAMAVQAEETTEASERSDEDALRLESSVVTGNRELPKVMSIVPWKKSVPGEITGRPANSLLDEMLSPVDREVFRRELRYYTRLVEKRQAQSREAGS